MNRPYLRLGIIIFVSLLFSMCQGADAPPKRSQVPKQPLPYREEQVGIQNTNSSVHLAGTLSLPAGAGPFPAVLLISGSGPQDRDEGILGHRPFLVIADHLVRRGIVVLRLDDRGVGESTGDYATALNRDFAEDAWFGVQFLKTRKEVRPDQVGLLGHSAGGVIAALVTQRTEISFLVLLASPGLRGVDFVTHRDRFLLEFANITVPADRRNTSAQRWREINGILMADLTAQEVDDRIRPIITKELQELTDQEAELFKGLGMELKADVILQEINTPWYRDNLKHDPGTVLRQVKCPVLALYGDKDIFVPAAENSRATAKALRLGGNQRVTVETLHLKNHFFQTCKTGMPMETYLLAETMSPSVLTRIGDWIEAVAKDGLRTEEPKTQQQTATGSGS